MGMRRLLRRMRRHRLSPAEENVMLSREQVLLSKERTVLSFMRTGLTFILAGVAVVNLFYQNPASLVIGVALILLGAVETADSYRRLTVYRKKMSRINRALGYEV
jgi:uncharacterized membrane protein YidH (DUF202 family)